MDVTYHGEEAYATRRGRDPRHPRGRGRGRAAGRRRGLAVRGSIQGVDEVTIETDAGPARAYLHRADEPSGALILGHGAGGGVEAPDLVAATEAALEAGVSVALVEQPYRVAGKRSSPAATQLDPAWVAVVDELRAGELADLPLIVGGRSAGARVACRTAADDRRGRRPLPRLPAAAAAAQVGRRVAQPPARARGGRGADAGRPGRGRPVRDPARGRAPLGRARRRRPQPAQGPRGGGRGGARAGCRASSAPPARR